jgi:hypothetical protein
MTNVSRMGLLSPADFLTRTDKSVPNLVRCEMRVLFRLASQGNKTLLDRVQITRLDESIPRWQIRDLKVSTSQLRYALRASEQQIQEAINLKPGQHMLIDLYPPQEL